MKKERNKGSCRHVSGAIRHHAPASLGVLRCKKIADAARNRRGVLLGCGAHRIQRHDRIIHIAVISREITPPAVGILIRNKSLDISADIRAGPSLRKDPLREVVVAFQGECIDPVYGALIGCIGLTEKTIGFNDDGRVAEAAPRSPAPVGLLAAFQPGDASRHFGGLGVGKGGRKKCAYENEEYLDQS